ncbi:MAG: class I SAM-dependent methyltransferase [Alphaproteobacteria bacterium]
MADSDRWHKPEFVAEWDSANHARWPERDSQVAYLAALAAAAWQPASWIADYACGTGLVAEPLLGRDERVQVLEIDYSAACLKRAGERLAPFGSRVRTLQADLTTLEAADLAATPISVALCVQSFHHFPDHEKARQMKVMADALLPGGLFLTLDRFAPSDDRLMDDYRAFWAEQGRQLAEAPVAEKSASENRTGSGETAANLDWFLASLRALGLTATVLTLAGTRGIVAARKPA